MRPRISRSNINFYLRQQYGFPDMKQFFKQTEYHLKIREQIIANITKEFTGYFFKLGKLVSHNPYTGKYEALNIENFGHIVDADTLMKDLSMLHKSRIRMLDQSRKRILELTQEKKNARDEDLDINVQTEGKAPQRLQELSTNTPEPDKELER